MTVYQEGVRYCAVDGALLRMNSEPVNQCITCGQVYPTGTNYCSADGGQVRVTFRQHAQRTTPGGPKTSVNLASRARYRKANFGDRLVALVIDLFVTLTLSIPALIALASAGLDVLKGDLSGILEALGLSALSLLLPAYYELFKDGISQGQSWGKASMGLMVVNVESNTPCNNWSSFLRNAIALLIAWIPYVGWLVDLVMVTVTVDGRKLGDLAANTQVIYAKDYYSR
jgi:uncharacterized RDD family membrane protein YckC